MLIGCSSIFTTCKVIIWVSSTAASASGACECKEDCKDEKKGKYIRREFSCTKIHQTLILPEDIDKDAIKATVENGILVIDIPKLLKPKAEEEKRMIEVK